VVINPIDAGPALRTQSVTVRFGGVTALSKVSFVAEAGSVTGLIGPNGAGKTSLLNVLSGFVKPTEGSVSLGSEKMEGRAPHWFARHGIARTFQNVRLFGDLTVLENLMVPGVESGLTVRQAQHRAEELLEWIGLPALANRAASELAYGQERLVGMGRALALAPTFVLLDEPAAGMANAECAALAALIKQLPQRFQCGVVLIEHNMDVIMPTASRIHVLANGSTLAVGTAGEIAENSLVRSVYLGEPGGEL
jgi:branched-chain amino acid transport system ATP-binding protein